MSATLATDDIVITFTQRGERALDALAQNLVAGAELTPAGIADLLERLVTTRIHVLADAMVTAAASCGAQGAVPSEPKGVRS